MFLLIAFVVVIAFVVSVAAAVVISAGRAASVDHSAVLSLVLDHTSPSARARRRVM
jgi:hypothetical protein